MTVPARCHLTYHCWTADHGLDAARAAFVRKYGHLPALEFVDACHCARNGGPKCRCVLLIRLGPVEGTEHG